MLYLVPMRQPMSLPFADYVARVERIIQKRTGMCLSLRCEGLRSYHFAGVSPLEAADDFIATC